jgi:hypothetical protein
MKRYKKITKKLFSLLPILVILPLLSYDNNVFRAPGDIMVEYPNVLYYYIAALLHPITTTADDIPRDEFETKIDFHTLVN